MIFSWDEAKASTNRRKHGVSFELACLVFNDPLCLSRRDNQGHHETRYQTIGRVDPVTLLVVHTWDIIEDGKEHVRIISARRATATERRAYENESWDHS